jgi:hypothetical protein
MKKILLHIDPCDRRWEMLATRSRVFLNLATILTESGLEVQCFGPSGVMLPFANIVGKEKITESNYVYQGTDSYHSLAWSNSLQEQDFASLVCEYRKIEEDFDIVVTNTPSALVRSIWPSSLILHFELGFFNRSPFPVCYQFDPFGFYHKSLLAKYPEIYSKNKWLQHDFLSDHMSRFRYRVETQSGIKRDKVGNIPSVYIPIPSDTWASKIEHDFSDRLAYISAMARMLPDRKILTNEKPQYPLTDRERNEIAKIKNIKVISNSDNMGVGSALTASCEATLTYSPSLSLQSIFWGNKFIPPNGCSMSAWGGLENAQDVLSSYIFNFQVFDLNEFMFKSEVWKSVNNLRF